VDKTNPEVGTDLPEEYIDGVLNRFYEMGVRKETRFEEFIEMVCEIPDEEIDNHLSSLSYKYLDEEGELLYNDLIKIECLDEFVERLKLRFDLNGKFEIRNATNHMGYREYFKDKRIRDLVYERYAKDFEITGYEF
jgi:hypothetical protein